MQRFAIETEGLGKSYRSYRGDLARALEFATLGRLKGHDTFWALRGVDLRVEPGTVLGVCGANGAGKSTLLRILSGTTAPSEGRYRLRGRVMSLLELGLGFHMDLSGRENLHHHVTLLGFSRREVQHHSAAIVDFAELGPFIDEPLRTYSSGMAMRLGFSVAAMLDPEVLVLDEVFAVGDVAFQKKCIDRIHSFRDRGRTVVFCSHSIYDLRQFCDRVLWLREGRVELDGDPTQVTAEYASHMRSRQDLAQAARVGSGPPNLPRVTAVRVLRPGTEVELREIDTGDSVEVRVDWEKPAGHVGDLNLGVGLVREDNIVCVGLGTHFGSTRLRGEAGTVRLLLPRLQLLSGRYLVPVWLLDETGSHRFEEVLPGPPPGGAGQRRRGGRLPAAARVGGHAGLGPGLPASRGAGMSAGRGSAERRLSTVELALDGLPHPQNLFEFVTGSGHYHLGLVESPDDTAAAAADRLLLRAFPQLPSGGRILDVGAGLGGALGLLEGAGFRPLGLEPDAALVDYARSRLGPEARLLPRRLEDLVELEEDLDGLLLTEVLQHFRDLDALLSRCRDLLRPGGVVVVHDPELHERVRWEQVPYHPADALAAAARRAGFDPVERVDLSPQVAPSLPLLREAVARARIPLLQRFAGRPAIAAEVDELLAQLAHLEAGFAQGHLSYRRTVLRRPPDPRP